LRGKIPAVRVLDDGSNVVLQVEALEAMRQDNFVVFSHVWADGLGSNSEKGLPLCQVRRLAEIVSEVEECNHPTFWIDSLCIPEKRDLRKKSISMMGKIYSCSTAVVVLDRDILIAKTSIPLAEIFLSIYTSGWLGRLWTYQEGALARRLLFKMEDGLYE
jgi:Heterokaryon incompatibility protein (HET)